MTHNDLTLLSKSKFDRLRVSEKPHYGRSKHKNARRCNCNAESLNVKKYFRTNFRSPLKRATIYYSEADYAIITSQETFQCS